MAFRTPEKSKRPYGWRARIGLIVPSPNTVAETEFWRMAPEGVTIHTTRMLYRAQEVEDPLTDMEQFLPRVLEELRGLEVDVVAYGCTASALKTPYEETQKGIADELDLPTVTTMGSVLEAFRALGVESIAVGSPYTDATNEAESRFFESQGLTVTVDKGVRLFEGQQRGRHMNLVPKDAVEDLAMSIDSAEADAIFLSCSDMATLGSIERLEDKLGKPVITSAQATFWGALRAAGIDDRLEGCGRLLREH
ncbi:MAG: decarboxylase [Alphaproteobacteria bacterium]|nr:decarboxylase [Alphaproteobacteria bacterium]